jgi:hypothetical protein
MAYLDVSSVLLNPVFANKFRVTRRQQGISVKGRVEIVPTIFNNVVGVVTVAHGNDLERLPEEQRMGRNFVIVTKFRLRGPSGVIALGTQFLSDLILWEGDEHEVKVVEPYTKYGAGFIQAIVGSVSEIDQAAA